MNELQGGLHRLRASMPRRRPELKEFARTMQAVRGGLKIDQGSMAIRLGVSQRLLSNWENGYAQPEAKEHLHFIYRMHEVAPEWVETFALLFGLGEHPALEPLFPDEPEVPPPPPDVAPVPIPVASPPVEVVAPPPLPAPTREEVRALLDSVVREAADVVDVRASDLRRGLYAVLDALVDAGVSIEDARAALGMKAKERAGMKRGK